MPAFRFCWVSQQAPQRSTSESKDRSKFLIASSADAAQAASVGTMSKAKTAAKKASKAVAGAVANKGQRKGVAMRMRTRTCLRQRGIVSSCFVRCW